MKQFLFYILIVLTSFSFAQEDNEKQLRKSQIKANDFVHEGNELVSSDDFVSAEMEYRKAISEQPNLSAGAYNLAHSYFTKGNFEESLYRHQQAAANAKTKEERHKAFHNIGNILMQNKKCADAVNAYKNALRNNPTDDETRYNLALAKDCEKQQQEQEDKDGDNNRDKEQNQDQNKDQQEKDKNEEKEDKDGEEKEDKKDEGDKDKKDGDEKEDEDGKPKDEKKDKGKGEDNKDKKKQQPKPQQGQLSPQQIKSLLEAMNNQEQKVQEKINAEKVKGVKVKTEKDW